MFDDEPVEFRRDADDHATEDLDRRNIVRVDRASTAGASSEEDVFILPIWDESNCDALFGRDQRLRVRQVPADRQLALCRRPKAGIDLAADDASYIHLDKYLPLAAGFDVAEF